MVRQQLLYAEQMRDPGGFSLPVVLKKHVRPLVREHRNVVRVIIERVAVMVMHYFTGLQGPTEFPFCYRSVLVVALSGAAVPTPNIGVVRHPRSISIGSPTMPMKLGIALYQTR